MLVGDRIRAVREAKKLSQGDLERSTGLLRCYISRVENDHTVPSIETLEKLSRALGMKLYELLYDGDKPPLPRNSDPSDDKLWGASGREARYLSKLMRYLPRLSDPDRTLLLSTLEQMVKSRKR